MSAAAEPSLREAVQREITRARLITAQLEATGARVRSVCKESAQLRRSMARRRTMPPAPPSDAQQRIRELENQVVNLNAAMQTREVIAQAIGVLVARLQCTPELAFRMLVHASQNSNTKVRVIAERLLADVAGGTLSDSAEGLTGARPRRHP
jgi:ANTAR domain